MEKSPPLVIMQSLKPAQGIRVLMTYRKPRPDWVTSPSTTNAPVTNYVKR